MKKRYCLGLIACVMAMFFVAGCGVKQGTESDKVDELQQEVDVEAGSESQQNVETDEPQQEKEQAVGICFEGQDIEGNSVTESALSGSKLTMINVWATYCNPCLKEMPDLGELAGEYAPEDFQIIGIISDVQEGADGAAIGYAADLIIQTGADYTHLLLNRSIYDALLTNVTAVPTTFFVNENGEVLDAVVGAMKKSAWEEKINALLEE